MALIRTRRFVLPVLIEREAKHHGTDDQVVLAPRFGHSCRSSPRRTRATRSFHFGVRELYRVLILTDGNSLIRDLHGRTTRTGGT